MRGAYFAVGATGRRARPAAPLRCSMSFTRPATNQHRSRFACPEIVQSSSKHARVLFFDREIRRVTEVADLAVIDTVNLWQSIFWHALGPERARQLYGIPAPVGEIGNGSLC
jgi:hypothetical protein